MEISDTILSLFKELTPENRRSLLSDLYRSTETLQLEGTVKHCPHCSRSTITKHGMHNGEQRFRCSDCKKTFKETTGTAIGKIHKKSLFLKYQDSMINEGYAPITEIAGRFGISAPTAFAWRHKVLLSLPEVSAKFDGELEVDDLWVRYSQKGRKGLEYPKKRGATSHKGDNDYQVKIVTAVNSTQTEMKVTNIGRVKKSDIQRAIGDKITKKTILISDKHPSIKAFAESNKIPHISFTAKEHTDTEGKGVQRLNNIANRIDTLLNRTFKGVSTKYLQLYANWFKLKENNKGKTRDLDLQKEMLSKKFAWDLYSNVEKVYGNFIKNHSVRTYRCPQPERFKAQNWNQESINRYAFI